MFGARIVLTTSSKYNSRLVVRKESDNVKLGMKNLRNKRVKL